MTYYLILLAVNVVGFLTLHHQTHRIRRHLMAVQDDVNAVADRLTAAKNRIVTKIGDLEAQVAAGANVDLTGLSAAADALDAVAPEPTV